MKKYFRSTLLGGLALSALYFLTRLPFLTKLPVFADEAIYIRWAQLILDNAHRYLFFSLNDGKTPFFVWLTVLSLKLFANPLIAGRIVAVLAGFVQLWVTVHILKTLGGKKLAGVVGALLIILLPFWYFHHRIALMDGLMVALLSISWLFLLKATLAKKRPIQWVIAAGVAFGLALLTKIPALLFIPTLVLAPFLVKPKKLPLSTIISWSAGTLLIGLAVFLTLKLQPAFSQLFTRGNDFLYSPSELLAKGFWPVIWANTRLVLETLSSYLTLPVLLLPFAGLFQDSWRKKHALLILCAVSFIAPMILLGKTLYPRYFLPAALPLTVSAALVFEQFFRHTQRLFKNPLALFFRSALLILGVTYVLSASLEFLLISWKNTDYVPFVLADRSQYVTEWSSGHGIRQTTEYLLQEAQHHTVAVATEGFYGTLPDGILMYLHNKNVTNILVEGIGQPVVSIPESFREKAQHYEKVWLVVNAYREEMGLKENHLDLMLKEYCRPIGSPCLEVWNITSLVHTSK